MRTLLIAFPILLFFAACDCDDEPTPELTNDYLPLAIGNYWDFKSTGQPVNEIVEHREVEDYVTLNNHTYYMIVSTFFSETRSALNKDTAYYRIDNQGFVFVYKKSHGIEEKRYKLNGNDGDTWSYPFVNNYIADMRLSERAKTIGNHEVLNCKDYLFDVAQWADEEYTYTLAPGVGFIREFSDAWGMGQELNRARINGHVIEF